MSLFVERKDPFTGKINKRLLPITIEELMRWEAGELIQNVWPNLSSGDREFIKTGIADWDSHVLLQPPVSLEKDEQVANNDGIPISTQPEYRPPSSKTYSTIGVRRHKFYKVRPVLKYLNENIYLAGGSLRTLLKCSGENVSDFDLFFKTFEEVQKLRDKLEDDGWKNTYECPEGKLYSYKKKDHKIQLICETEYSSAEELILSFDLSACMVCYYDGVLTFTREFVRSVKTKKLRTCRVSFPVATIKRLIKYAQKGYECSMAAEDFCRQVSGLAFEGDQFRHYID